MIRKITALKKQKNNPQRVSVYLDGNYAFGLHRNLAAELRVGQELTIEAIDALLKKDAEEVTFNRVLKLIQFRDRSEAEVVQYLRKAGADEKVISSILEHLYHLELLDDRKFAENWVESRNALRPRSRKVLALELRRKGISEEVIAEVLQKAPSEEDLAYLSAMKQARRYSHLSREEFQRKLSDYLARRGFSFDTISFVVARLWGNTQKLESENILQGNER